MYAFKRYLFIRLSKLSPHPVPITVDAPNKDAAAERLQHHFPFIPLSDWDFLEELDPEHTLGALGEHIPLPLEH